MQPNIASLSFDDYIVSIIKTASLTSWTIRVVGVWDVTERMIVHL